MLIPYAGMGRETVSMTYGQPSLQARYVVKYKHNEGKLVLKITDDRTVRTRPIFARSKLTMLSPLRLYLHRPSHNVISTSSFQSTPVYLLRSLTRMPCTPHTINMDVLDHFLRACPQCLKFKTNSSVFLNRFEALNLSLMRKMQNTKPPAAPPAADVEMREATPVPATPAPAAPAQITSAAGGGGVKKKKGKKKK